MTALPGPAVQVEQEALEQRTEQAGLGPHRGLAESGLQ